MEYLEDVLPRDIRTHVLAATIGRDDRCERITRSGRLCNTGQEPPECIPYCLNRCRNFLKHLFDRFEWGTINTQLLDWGDTVTVNGTLVTVNEHLDTYFKFDSQTPNPKYIVDVPGTRQFHLANPHHQVQSTFSSSTAAARAVCKWRGNRQVSVVIRYSLQAPPNVNTISTVFEQRFGFNGWRYSIHHNMLYFFNVIDVDTMIYQ